MSIKRMPGTALDTTAGAAAAAVVPWSALAAALRSGHILILASPASSPAPSSLQVQLTTARQAQYDHSQQQQQQETAASATPSPPYRAYLIPDPTYAFSSIRLLLIFCSCSAYFSKQKSTIHKFRLSKKSKTLLEQQLPCKQHNNKNNR